MTKTTKTISLSNQNIDSARSESKMTAVVTGSSVVFTTWDGKSWEGTRYELNNYKRNGWVIK